MTADAIARQVTAAMSIDVGEFDERVAEEASSLKSQLREGVFDNPQAIVGLEYEFYAVVDGTARLTRMPRPLLRLIGFEKELGLHNAEMQTSPQPLNAPGLRTQLSEVQSRLGAAERRVRADDIRLVSDGMWVVPPPGEGALDYLVDHVRTDGVVVATNVSDAVRYHAFGNAHLELGRRIDLPGATVETTTVGPASLTQTIQPHLQVPQAIDLPEYFRYALRIAGPILSLGVNSPFLPPELYDSPPEEVLERGYRENRIPVFEGTMNPVKAPDKVRFPRDIDTVETAVDRIAADPTIVPADLEVVDPDGQFAFHETFPHFRHKHGSYWRWVRPVFDGRSRSAANARIEFRPLPAQPTVPDTVAFQALFGGALVALQAVEHPVANMSWEQAKENFYAGARDGLEADLHWITADGEETTTPDVLFDELFGYAREGLRSRGVPDGEIDAHLAPLRDRFDRGITPAEWKRTQVKERIDEGAGFTEAVYATQEEYVDRQRDTLFKGRFTDWLE